MHSYLLHPLNPKLYTFRSGMRCEKLSSLGDTCRNTEGNENPTDFYIFKCPCAEGLECQVNQSDVSIRSVVY